MRNLLKEFSNDIQIKPLIIPEGASGGLTNPSVYYDEETGKLLCNLRHVGYTLYQNRDFPHLYGPLQYIHPEGDRTLRTTNYMLELDVDLSINRVKKVEMLDLGEPKWEFIGLEDARVVRWNGNLCLIGVRRDTTTNGQGRMEYSILNSEYEETTRIRVPAPDPDQSYCEKNWIPILEQPNYFVKWTNPTEIVEFKGGKTTTKHLSEKTYGGYPRDIRGGSQVIFHEDYYYAIMHECALYKNGQNQKDADYLHRIVRWDQNFEVDTISSPFYFFNGPIEFCCGLTKFMDDVIFTFGHQDNAAYIVRIEIGDFVRACLS